MFAWWPQGLNLVTVKGGQSIKQHLFGDVEFLGHHPCVARPPSYALQVFESHEKACRFEADLTFNGRWLASIVTMLDVNCFVGEETTSFHCCECWINPYSPAVSGSDYVWIRAIPNDNDLRE